MKIRHIITLLAALLLLIPFTSCAPSELQVVNVIDGDTIEVNIDGEVCAVRYIGIDAPELNDKRPELRILAEAAAIYNRELVEGKTVRLERDMSESDKYRRLLRYVYVDDVFVNAELVRQGLAEAKAYLPDTKYQVYLQKLELEARLAHKGIWAITP